MLSDNFDFENLVLKNSSENKKKTSKKKTDFKVVLVYMKPSDFISSVVRSSLDAKVDSLKITEIKEAYNSGTKLQVPYLSYGDMKSDSFSQSGFNIAFYFNSIGSKEIPVEIRYREDDKRITHILKKYFDLNYVSENYKQFLGIKNDVDFAKWKKDCLNFKSGAFNQLSLYSFAKAHFKPHGEAKQYENQNVYLSSLESAINTGLSIEEENLLKIKKQI